ncbi:iron-containing alcohol dehydrogenase [Alkaliphilus sp. B6464]|uniref:iron-containing alcohol dehydrogenase n=1 Tax=Alkaliphilus sp. B6464 TaxID=2731219 RepID=UPI001BA6586E|nr:iron-containing alcohol dehydrogenase [Alkaliphilus sp. B6464]QUH18541.1 iron-containing alcohol dehydrogenase [Alkaliphilus sp. B6464]
MKNFVYQNPTKIIFGQGTINQIGKEIKNHGINKVLIIYGGGSILKNGVYEEVTKSLKEHDVGYVEVSGVQPNPVLGKVQEAINKAKEEKVEGLLAIGGGSVYDTTKAVAIGCHYDGSVWDFYEGTAKPKSAMPFFGVLTISATASEMNMGSVITNEAEDKKWSCGSPVMYPKVSIIDPNVQATLPPNQTANTAIDTMAHVFELYFDGTEDVDVLLEYSEGIIRSTMKHVKILLEDPTNYQSRAQLAWCATLGLNGSNGVGRSGGDWASHGIEHSLSVLYGVAHGAGLAIVFPAWMKYVYKENIDMFERFAEQIFNIKEGTKEEKALKGIEELKMFFSSLNAPVTLKEIGVKFEDLDKIADNAAMQVPRGAIKKLYREDILEILKIAYE